MIIIALNGDLIVKVVETHAIVTSEDATTESDNSSPTPSRNEDFRVRRKTLSEASSVWSKMLNSNSYLEGRSTEIEFHESHILSMEILFRALHNAEDPGTYEASILDVWKLVGLVNQWQLKIEFLYPWYAKWYGAQGYDSKKLDVLGRRQLLFPCWRFQHAQGFAAATRLLAYNCSAHIEEHNPSDYDNLHLPHRIISQLNAARGRLRTIVHRELYRPIKDLLEANCSCKGNTLWGYEKELTNAGVWPLEDIGRYTTMQTIIERLEDFTYKVPENTCMRCRRPRLHGSQESKLRDHDEDYWNHSKFLSEDGWFKHCRVHYKQPTWYYSFMGRQQDRDWLQRKEKRPYDSDEDNF